MFNNIQLLIFDLDGVLVDSSAAIVETVNKVLANNGHKAISTEKIRSLIGHHLIDIYKVAVPDLKDATAKQWVQDYIAHFQTISVANSFLYPHVKEVLSFFQGKKKISLATTKGEPEARRLLHGLGCENYFDLMLGFNNVVNTKPDPEMIFKTLDYFKLKPEQAVIIGDTTLDIRAGKSAGIHTIGITTGTDTKETLLASSPDLIIDNLEELKEIILLRN